MKESRMFEGLTTCLNYCLEMGLDDEAQVIEAFIKTWDKMDYYGKKNMTLDYYQDLTYQNITRKIRMGVKEGLYKFERNKETGKLELIDLREEEE